MRRPAKNITGLELTKSINRCAFLKIIITLSIPFVLLNYLILPKLFNNCSTSKYFHEGDIDERIADQHRLDNERRLNFKKNLREYIQNSKKRQKICSGKFSFDFTITLLSSHRFDEDRSYSPNYTIQSFNVLLKEYNELFYDYCRSDIGYCCRDEFPFIRFIIWNIELDYKKNEELKLIHETLMSLTLEGDEQETIDIINYYQPTKMEEITKIISGTKMKTTEKGTNIQSEFFLDRDLLTRKQTETTLDYEKEKFDYVIPLLYSYSIKSDNYLPHIILLMEDDAYANEKILKELFHQFLNPTNGRLMRRSTSNLNDDSYNGIKSNYNTTLYVKLFHPQHLSSYNSLAFDRSIKLFILPILLIPFYLLLTFPIYPSFIRACFHNKSVILIIYFFSFILVFNIGYITYQQFTQQMTHHYDMTSAPSCCTPANLFFAPTIPLIGRYLLERKARRRYAKDSILDELHSTYYWSNGYRARLIQPNMFRHIGLYSRLHKGRINPFFVS
ncbi:hypothetical protein SNEBB_003601 [Seison nebaliae]|nr:hypothetical protein SNEBB_003601 [Seison nebaliae]